MGEAVAGLPGFFSPIASLKISFSDGIWAISPLSFCCFKTSLFRVSISSNCDISFSKVENSGINLKIA